MIRRNREYIEFLKEKFNEQKYIEFINDLLNLSNEDINTSIVELVPNQKQFKDKIDYYKFVAKYTSNSDKIGIFIVKLSTEGHQNARTSQRAFISTLLSKYNLDASIVAFYQDNEASWRLSFVKKELNFTETGIKVDLSPAKRYSYLVGKNEAVHTAQEYLFKLFEIEDRKITLSDIEKVFDVEKVTKKFFEEYKEKYLKLKEYLDNNEDFITESKNCDFTSVEFAKKLMGQIVFLYFLQKKGWLGVQLVPNELSIEEYNDLLNSNDSVSNNLIRYFYKLNEEIYVIDKNKLITAEVQDITNFSNIFVKTKYNMPWGTGKKDFIRTIYKQSIKEHKNFFDSYIEQFFYNGLNEKRENQYFPLFNCKIPFLNGGLFEPINNYRWSSSRFSIPNEMFSNDKKTGILDFLDLYNFTIDEEEPLEKEIAVDPEMLGKIFENLLEVDDRKSKGAFYTPREIVYYMCQESLANYLVNKVGIDYNEIILFIKYGDLISQIDWETSLDNIDSHELGNTIYDNIIEIDKALMNVKIADPAVGSGAFPLGMLTEIVKLRNNLTTYILIQKELGKIDFDSIINSEQRNRDIFDMKLQTIENCIYAVDIETSAIDIAKLRLWLSLIVDYPNDEEPKPLPNLDCKIMQGNSLIDEFEGVPLFSKKILKNSLRKNASKVEVEQNIYGEVSNIYIQQSLKFDSNEVDYNDYIDKMVLIQKQYFSTVDNKLKKDLKKKIEKIQFDMVEESLKNEPIKLEKFRNIANKKQKPWFIWELEFYDVFKENSGFDIVIGNPPYVSAVSTSQEDIEQRTIIRKKYNQITGAFDLYIAFLLLSTIIGNNSSIYSFIIPNKLLVSDYAKKTFIHLKKNGLNKVISLSHINVFDSASVYPIIIIGNKNNNDYHEYKVETIDNLNNRRYQQKIKLHLKNTFKSVGIKISSGATGFQAKSLINYLSNEQKKSSIPFAVSGCINKYSINNKNVRYMGNTYSEAFITKGDDIADSKWLFWNEPKIIIAGMTKVIESTYVKTPYALGVGVYGIYDYANYNPLFIVGLLNSKYMSYYLNIMFEEKHLAGGYLAINKSTIEELPFVKPTKEIENIISKYVNQILENLDKTLEIQKNIDTLVYKLFNLDEETISNIEKFYTENNLNKCGFN